MKTYRIYPASSASTRSLDIHAASMTEAIREFGRTIGLTITTYPDAEEYFTIGTGLAFTIVEVD